MKTLQNQTLLYDKDCPLCNVYTRGFIKAKMLDSNGRKAYCDLNNDEQHFIDLQRATNEIALFDTNNKTVIYGIDSLLRVIGNSMPWVEKIGNLKPVKLGLKKLYSFISFNRKVIIPNKEDSSQKLQCVPDFNYKYRYIYILIATLITSLVLFNFSRMISIIPESNFLRECLIALGQIGFQALFISKLKSDKQINYLGNLMTVSLMGSLFLIPVLIINSFFVIPEIALLAWFGLTVTLMLLEHLRRVKILELPKYLSATWLLYRVVVLLLILSL
ncbi:DCC1-like thiol-disulfide oxidoreductase family protein [Winogradskyella forsetii]|uniref:DCC1-like thiol-disulfide oxidoreductase family protein n=1 Tax=Winogradskyella forsetii TaxID=2686077 RepID=UPI0015B8E83A|nr:DCC1-like thiol-disulfide oxidoreductase family protein [Winogradskyella forsetii]